jgi:hypothetical protein
MQTQAVFRSKPMRWHNDGQWYINGALGISGKLTHWQSMIFSLAEESES